MKTFFLYFLLFGILCVFLSLPQQRLAAQIGVSTMGIWVEVPAGRSKSGEIVVANYHTEERLLEAKIVDWRHSEGGDNIMLIADTLPKSLAPWIQIKPKRFVLPAGETRKVRYTVNMPPAAKGSLWCTIAIHAVADKQREVFEQTGKGFQIRFRARYGFAVKVWAIEPGTARAQGDITHLELSQRSSAEGPQNYISLTFHNRGNIPLRPSGTIQIADLGGETTQNLSVDKFGILPDEKRLLEISLDGRQLPPGRYRALGTLHYGDGKTARNEVTFTVPEKTGSGAEL